MNKKLLILFILFVITLQSFVPMIYATTENSEDIFCDNNVDVLDEENIEGQEALDTDIYGDLNYENIIENDSINIEPKIELKNKLKSNINKSSGISIMSASGSGTGAGNEVEFRNALYNTSVTELTTSTNIRLTSTYTLNHSIRIDNSSSIGNALQLSSGCQIIVPQGCVLTLDAMVIDGRQFGNDDNKPCIVVQSGGCLMLTEHTIIDGGYKNCGIRVEDGGTLYVQSCQISYCDRGIVLVGNSYCSFGNNKAVDWWGTTNKLTEITYNNIGIYCGGQYKGTLIVDTISKTTEQTNFENNKEGIFLEAHDGNVSIVNARIVFNDYAIHTYGNITINNINAAFNVRGIVNEGGTINFKSGSFYSNSSDLKEYGIYNKSGSINIQGR